MFSPQNTPGHTNQHIFHSPFTVFFQPGKQAWRYRLSHCLAHERVTTKRKISGQQWQDRSSKAAGDAEDVTTQLHKPRTTHLGTLGMWEKFILVCLSHCCRDSTEAIFIQSDLIGIEQKIQHYEEMFELCLINDDSCPKFVVCPDLLGNDSEMCIYMLNNNTTYIKYKYNIYTYISINIIKIYTYLHINISIIHINIL